MNILSIRVLRLRDRSFTFWRGATLNAERGWLLAVGSWALFIGADRGQR